MQKILLLLLLVAGAVTVQAQAQSQSLKDLLYGGKLKIDSNTVVRKTDDLATKIDTVQKKPVVAAEKAGPAATADSATAKKVTKDSLGLANNTYNLVDSVVATVEGEAAEEEIVTPTVPAKSNTRLWKEFTDSLVTTLKPDVDRANKIRKGTYHVLVSYEIETDGRVAVTNVGITPGNDLLQAQVRQYLDGTALQLAPTMDSAGKPRKTRRSGSFTITKD